jgi:hypothetical protein
MASKIRFFGQFLIEFIFSEKFGWYISKRIIFAPHLSVGREGNLTHPLPHSKDREG